MNELVNSLFFSSGIAMERTSSSPQAKQCFSARTDHSDPPQGSECGAISAELAGSKRAIFFLLTKKIINDSLTSFVISEIVRVALKFQRKKYVVMLAASFTLAARTPSSRIRFSQMLFPILQPAHSQLAPLTARFIETVRLAGMPFGSA